MLSHVVISIVLILLVLLQRSEGGLGSLGGGGGDAMFSGSSAGSVLTRMTKWLFIVYVALSLGLSIEMAGKGGIDSVLDKQPAALTPSVPVEVE